MEQEETVQFFMEKGLCDAAQSGQHNFINKVAGILENSQFRVEFYNIQDQTKVDPTGRSLTHMKAPVTKDG